MISELRKKFNSQFTPAKYQALLKEMELQCGVPVQFRISETPCFLPNSLLRKMSQYGAELISQLTAPEYIAKSQRSIPGEFDVPNESAHPMFIQVDFGLERDASGELQPKLVELQGFPSLYAYQPVLAQAYLDVFGIEGVQFFMNGLDSRSYVELLRRAIVGGHDPQNVVLMEIDPLHQKTLPDFLVTERMLGIKTVDIGDIKKDGSQLSYESNGKRVPIERIYNRAIVDELVRKNVKMDFRLTDDLDVEWAGHPNWFFRMSKYSIPFLNHPSVPETRFLTDAHEIADLEPWILKPLFSFAGSGIVLHPTKDDLARIPEAHRQDYILQERIDFAPVIDTPLGPTKPEIRVMYIWDEELLPVLTIIRMGRGEMMGVDHNKNMDWVGSSAGFFLENLQ